MINPALKVCTSNSPELKVCTSGDLVRWIFADDKTTLNKIIKDEWHHHY